jgi:hypothetical protein
MNDPRVVSTDEWLAARRELLAQEKEFTRQRDALNTGRRRLPMVEVGKEYLFQGPDGQATLPGRAQRRPAAELAPSPRQVRCVAATDRPGTAWQATRC